MARESDRAMFWLNTTPQYLRSSVEIDSPLEGKIAKFKNSLNPGKNQSSYGYSEDSRLLIDYSINLARLHNVNDLERKRFRKYDGVAYLEHPLSMAEEAARMKLHPTIVTACFLHDVPEDVRYRFVSKPQEWINFLEHAYEGYEDKDRLMRILRTEMKTETLAGKFKDKNERQEVVEYYMDSPIGKVAKKYLRDLRGDQNYEPPEWDTTHIAEVAFDINRLFTESFVEQPNGNREFDASILIVKILDTWQNLQTPGFFREQLQDPNSDAKTVAKLIRARILTNVAEFLGMRRVATEMTSALSAVQDISQIDFPMLGELVKGSSTEQFEQRKRGLAKEYKEAEKRSAHVTSMLNMPSFTKKGITRTVGTAQQMPWGEPNGASVIPGRSGAPRTNLVYIAPDDQDHPTTIRNQTKDEYEIENMPLGVADGVIRPEIYTLLGRNTQEYVLRNKKVWGDDYCRLRIEEAVKPRVISAYRSINSERLVEETEHQKARTATQEESPECNLLHPDICKYMGPIDDSGYGPSCLRGIVDPKLMGLVNFMFSPHKFITNSTGESDVPYVIFVGNKMYLATNQTNATIWDIAQQGGVSDPMVKSLESNRLHTVESGDAHVLDRMRKDGEIEKYNVVIMSNPNREQHIPTE